MRRGFPLALLCGLFLAAGAGGAEEGSFDSGGVKIHYVAAGKGEPVVLIHGFALNTYLNWDWPGIYRTLSRHYRVIALDVRGHGKSDKPAGADKYGTEMVEDVVRLLDHLKIEKAHVVGYSMGALIAGKLLATHPDRLLSATLGGSGVIVEGKMPKFMVKLADSLERGKGLRPLVEAITPPGTPKLSPAAIEVLNNSFVGENSKLLAAVARSWKELGVTKEQLKANKVPTLVLIGANDPLKSGVDSMQEDMANLKVVVIEKVGHVDAYFHPKFVNDLRQFLDEHKTSRKR